MLQKPGLFIHCQAQSARQGCEDTDSLVFCSASFGREMAKGGGPEERQAQTQVNDTINSVFLRIPWNQHPPGWTKPFFTSYHHKRVAAKSSEVRCHHVFCKDVARTQRCLLHSAWFISILLLLLRAAAPPVSSAAEHVPVRAQ